MVFLAVIKAAIPTAALVPVALTPRHGGTRNVVAALCAKVVLLHPPGNPEVDAEGVRQRERYM